MNAEEHATEAERLLTEAAAIAVSEDDESQGMYLLRAQVHAQLADVRVAQEQIEVMREAARSFLAGLGEVLRSAVPALVQVVAEAPRRWSK